VGLISLVGFLFIPSIYNEAGTVHYGFGYLVKLACIFFLFHTVLHNAYMKKLFSTEIIIIIGGMCYSIYLLHLAIISAAGTVLLKAGIDINNRIYFLFYFLLLTFLVLAISALYFLFVEKPFMKPISWLKKLR
jgi:peptidoglycan/LPS O-acetylase OafA/YrhL